MMTIYTHELKMKMKSIVTWSLSIALLLFVFISVFTSVAGEMEALNQLLEHYPKELLIAFGLDGLDLSSVLGFLGFVLVFCQLCVSIQAANYGVSLVSVEERELTADFLLAKPISRVKILTSKLLAAITSLAITFGIAAASTVLFINLYNSKDSYDAGILTLMLLTMGFLQLFFLTVGLIISLVMKRVRSVTAVSLGLVFGLYILNTFSGALDKNRFGYLTPFKHFELSRIIQTGGYNLPLVLVSAAVIVLSAVGSYVLYQRRNIHSL